MSDPRPNAELRELLTRPREALDIEIKGWLDLSDANQRADLAKAILAIGNHGGGFVIIGFDESDAGQFSPGVNRPADLSSLSQDDIQNAVQKYLEPAIQCRVEHVTHTDGHGSFPIIVVPGGLRTPIKAKAGSPDGKLSAHRVYIRRPGPRSEEPQTAAEWDQLFERCIRARRDELLDGIRDLLAGTAPPAAPVMLSAYEQLSSFIEKSEQRWNERISKTPHDAPARFPHGYYDAGFAIDSELPRQSLSDLASTVQRSIRNHSGWPPFAYLYKEPLRPRPVDGAIEAWFGPDDRQFEDAAHSDFWRIAPDGCFYIRRGYSEDGGFRDMKPGKYFDITTPTWRTAEVIMEVYYVASNMGASDETLLSKFRWKGLSGRRLVSVGNQNRILSDINRESVQDEFEIHKQIKIGTVPDALPEIVWDILSPLYQLFDFWQLPKRLVEEEIRSLLRNTFAT